MASDLSSQSTVGSLIDAAELQPIHWRIWFLSAMGVFLDGFDLFIVAVAMPLIVTSLSPSPAMQGLIGASTVVGAIVGASVLGHFTDRWGRKYLYLADLSIFIVLAVLSGFAWDTYSLITFRFLLGIGIGADYPICASYVTEFMPARMRGRMLVGAFSFQALGMLGAAVTGLLLLKLIFYSALIKVSLFWDVSSAQQICGTRFRIPGGRDRVIDGCGAARFGRWEAELLPRHGTRCCTFLWAGSAG
jgi:MFS family permease